MMESCDIPIIPPNQTRTLSGNAQAAAVVDLLRSFRAEKGARVLQGGEKPSNYAGL